MRVFIGLIICLLFVSCDPSKRFMKQGNEQFEIGNMDGAANFYYNALLVQPEKTEAKEGLKKTGNSVLQGKFLIFSKYVVANEADLSVKQYGYCKKYYDRCKSVGVVLDWPTMYDPIYEDIKNELISKKFDEGIKFMQNNNYDAAENMFDEIAAIDSTYKNATVMRLKSIIEPLYQHGNKMMKEGNYKEANRDFKKVIDLDPNYKNAVTLSKEVTQLAKIDLGVPPVQNQTRIQGFDVRLYQNLLANLGQTNSPFLSVIDRGGLETLLREKNAAVKDIVDVESATSYGKSVGLEYVLLTAINELIYEDDGVILDSNIAYLALTESKPSKDPNSVPKVVTRFKKVKYTDEHQKRRLVISVVYQLISTKTGQVVTSEIVKDEEGDEFHFCSFLGNINSLYPELPIGNVMPPNPIEFREQFNQVKREIKPKEEITKELCYRLSKKIIDDLNIYLER